MEVKSEIQTEFVFNICSSKNCTFNYKCHFDIFDMGYESQEEWDETHPTEAAKEKEIKEFIEESIMPNYIEWGWE